MTQKRCKYHISQSNEGNFTQFWSLTYVFGFADVLIRFWDQKVKGQGHNRQ